MEAKGKTEAQQAAVDEALRLNPLCGDRKIQRLLAETGTKVSHTYVANRRRVMVSGWSSAKSEQEIEKAVAHHYRTCFPLSDVQTQVATPIGPADIVVDGEVIEVKLRLTREAIFKALGQVLAYQSVIGDPKKRGFIVAGGYFPDERPLIEQVINLGIGVFLWDEEKLIPWAEFCAQSSRLVKLDG